MDLYNLMYHAQQGNQECCYAIIQKFEKLIKKYARKLSYEDAEEDLICFVVELIQLFPLENFSEKDEGKIVTYIVNSIRHRYIFLLKRLIDRENEIRMSEMSQEQQFMVERKLSFEEPYETLFFDDIRSLLSEKEWLILQAIYIQGMTSAEVARKEGLTRQAVNQTKIRGLKKLKKSYLASISDKPPLLK